MGENHKAGFTRRGSVLCSKTTRILLRDCGAVFGCETRQKMCFTCKNCSVNNYHKTVAICGEACGLATQQLVAWNTTTAMKPA